MGLSHEEKKKRSPFQLWITDALVGCWKYETVDKKFLQVFNGLDGNTLTTLAVLGEPLNDKK